MKKVFLFLAMILLMAGCKKNNQALVPVHVHANDFGVLVDDFPTKGEPVGTYTNVKTMTLAFFKADGTAQYNVSQLRDDPTTYETFGEFSCDLPVGDYTMVVIGSACTVPFNLISPTSATLMDEKLWDSFVATQEVHVTGTDAVDLSATLNRIVSRCCVSTTDVRPEEVTKVRMTFPAGGRDFSPSTGLATVNTGFSNSITLPNAAGTTSSFATYLFLASDEQTMGVTLETLDDDDNVVFSTTVSDVPLQRNRQTILTGKLFSADAGAGSFTIETTWLPNLNVPF